MNPDTRLAEIIMRVSQMLQTRSYQNPDTTYFDLAALYCLGINQDDATCQQNVSNLMASRDTFIATQRSFQEQRAVHDQRLCPTQATTKL